MLYIIVIIIITLLYIFFYWYKKYLIDSTDFDYTPIKKIPIIVSLTTSPKRINNIKIVIDQILNQTIPPDYIYLNLPKVFKRTGETFKDIPNFLIHPKIKIKFVEDIGPITKILPTLQDNLHDDTLVISIDDDIYYGNNMIEVLLKYHYKYHNYVLNGNISSSLSIKLNKILEILNIKRPFWHKQNNYEKFSIYPYEIYKNIKRMYINTKKYFVQGFSAIAYPYKLFKGININMDLPKVCYFSDDFIISNYLNNKKIPIINIGNYIISPFIVKPYEFGTQKDALHKGSGIKSNGNGIIIIHSNNYKECAKYYNSIGELAKELKPWLH